MTSGDFGLGFREHPDGTFELFRFKQLVTPDDVAFRSGVYLQTK